MSSEFGHVKISRKAYLPAEAGGDPFWNERREFSRWEAWEYMIQSAAYSDHTRVVGGEPVMVPRGHTPPLALSYLAEAWGWGVKRVRNFLELLDKMDRIRAVGGARSGTVYLVLNYDYYQSTANGKGTERDGLGARSGHAEGTPGAGNRSKEANKQGNMDGGRSAPAKRATQLPVAWEPTAKHREIAAGLGVDLDSEVEQFKDHHMAKGTAFKDWDAAFRTWLRNARRFQGGRAPTGDGAAVALDLGVWGR